MKRVVTLFMVLALAAPVLAQDLPRHPLTLKQAAQKQADDAPRVRHVTDKLNSTPEARAALRAFHEAKAAGLLPARKAKDDFNVGDTTEFNTLQNLDDPQNQRWTQRKFVLMGKNEVANVWIETLMLDQGHLSQSDIDDLTTALLDETPARSFNPAQGIVANTNEVYGQPPNYDGDGVVDILLYDIMEGGSCCTLGFVTYADLFPNPPAGVGNQADVLHLDANEGVKNFPKSTLLSVAAHEYTHLVHFNYDLVDPSTGGFREEIFVGEGLAEYGMVLNGYGFTTLHDLGYLSDAQERNISLYTWRGSENDYARGGLLISYLAERIGAREAGAILRDDNRGTAGFQSVLSPYGLDFETLLTDWHTANVLNDTAVESRFGYANPFFSDTRAGVQQIVDGRTATSTPVTVDTVAGGGVIYRVWQKVEDFEFSQEILVEAGQTPSSSVARARLRALLERPGAPLEVRDLNPGQNTHIFDGAYDRITLIIGHAKPVSSRAIGVGSDRVIYQYSANWGNEQTFTAQEIVYDDGRAAEDADGFWAYLLDNEGLARVANRFDVPAGSVLGTVSVTPYYENQFSNSEVPNDAPRNFRLHVWADDGNGEPGDELFSLELDDPRGNSNRTYNFFEIDLAEYAAELTGLPSPVYIGVTNTGDDKNYIVLTASLYTGEPVSYLHMPQFGPNNSGGWALMAGVTLGGVPVFAERALPIRATFLIPSAPVPVEGVAELPEAFTLEQNYPNPFNPTTAIRYSLPRTAEVRLTVFDVLGRHVATLFDGRQAAGAYEMPFEASAWASGLYFYTLETPERTLTRKMLLLK